MEFEFRKDFISGDATIKTSMDHEAFATWLEMEGQSKKWVISLIDIIEKLQRKQLTEYKLVGSEFTLQLSIEEASVVNHRLLAEDEEIDFEEDLSFYNLEIEGACGLEDFSNLITAWLEFI